MKILPFLLIFLLALSACRTSKQTQTEYVYVHDTDTVEHVIHRLDSIVISDSIVIYQKGDTIYKEKYHTELKERVRTDTLIKFITKKLYYTNEVEKEIEVNKLYWWQKALMWIGSSSLLLTICLMILKLRKIFQKR